MLPTDKKITIATIDDAAALTELGITTFRETFDADNNPADMDKYITEEMNEDRISAELADGNNTFFLGWDKGVLIGYAKVRSTKIPDALKGQQPLEIERLYVLKAYLGTKTGAALMQRCIDHAAATQCNVVWLGVWEHNQRAVKFYERWGFTVFGSHIFRLGDDDQTDILMKKPL